SPVFVIALGDPWISDIGNAAVPVNMQRVKSVSLIVSKSHNLRLLVQVPSMHAAQRSKAHITPTDTGLRAEIDIPD
ncbi:hypothetical protein LJB81_03855, partial [Desulfovibrio sp. OttesenSCG-928-M14]|nr:hypothetical protein [Desulfovibrio sp. OttesenSCG-928-M14]